MKSIKKNKFVKKSHPSTSNKSIFHFTLHQYFKSNKIKQGFSKTVYNFIQFYKIHIWFHLYKGVLRFSIYCLASSWDFTIFIEKFVYFMFSLTFMYIFTVCRCSISIHVVSKYIYTIVSILYPFYLKEAFYLPCKCFGLIFYQKLFIVYSLFISLLIEIYMCLVWFLVRYL